MTDTPDVVIDHAPEACAGCGVHLAQAAVTGRQRRQGIDLPVVAPVVTEHQASTSLYTLSHASATRGTEAVKEAGVLIGYRGVIIHDRLALYWKLKRARHGLCAAHLLRDLAAVAQVATQTAWAAGLAALLVEINTACEAARSAGHRSLAPSRQRGFRVRYDTLVAAGLAANPDPGRNATTFSGPPTTSRWPSTPTVKRSCATCTTSTSPSRTIRPSAICDR